MSENWRWHKGWGSSPAWTPETLCDDGGVSLTAEQKQVLDRAVAQAHSTGGEGHAEAGAISAVVNMRAGSNYDTPRFAVYDNGTGSVISGGMLAPAPEPVTVIERQRRIVERRLPDLYIKG